MSAGAFRASLVSQGRSIADRLDAREDETMNHWYMTERIAQERHADFQREVDVPTLLTSLEDVGDPQHGPVDRLVRSVNGLKGRLAGGLDRRLHHGLSGVGRHG
jgi:hypothetical protein